MKQVKYNLNQLTKPSQIFRKAAEHLKQNMEDSKIGWRDGCCCAFDEVANAAYDKLYDNTLFTSPLKQQSKERLVRKVNQTTKVVKESRELFNSLFKPRNASNDTYWFGKEMNDKQQQHRITALLLAADMAESEGK